MKKYGLKGNIKYMIDSKLLEKTPICHIHNIIRDRLYDLEEIYDLKQSDTLLAIRLLLDVAEEQGQKMEDRLKVYKNGIENLGFERKKGDKVESES